MLLASTSRSAFKPYLPLEPPCADCTTATECAEPLCASIELTAQCTDQCVVIACSDPDHEESACGGDAEHTHCDLVCDKNTGCTDCHGFDAFLQCCDNYHQNNSDLRSGPSSSPNSPFVWDSSLDDFWCACGQTGAHKAHVDSEKQTDTFISILPPVGRHTSDSHEKSSFTPDMPPTAFQIDPFRQPPYSSPEPPSLCSCMWGACNFSCTSLMELVEHVNLEHLSDMSSSATDKAMDYVDPSTQQNRLQPPNTCLWDNCTNPDHPPYYRSVESLHQHLMQEHLRLKSSSENHSTNDPTKHFIPVVPNSPSSVIVQDSLMADTGQYQMQIESPGSSPASTDPPHNCAGTHDCRWRDCGLAFHSCDDLTTHITSVHVGGGKAHYECFWEGCTRNDAHGFQSKQKICRHVQSHTGHRPFQCSICQQHFSEAATLQQHIRRHTQEKPYVCDYPGCNKSFAITGALTIHKRTHNGDKPFKCTYCERGFAESSNLSKHLRTHTGARPYICKEAGCTKTFARPDQLTRHKGVHRKQVKGGTATVLE
ncbi:hypothetical protein B0H34DRAFT_655371 [Crassisporium funariophilum]|nr:hypothetical protein B0H34DRAFT_655371 [Crassisporium funariophilum]